MMHRTRALALAKKALFPGSSGILELETVAGSRWLSTDLKSVLAQKIPEEQVRSCITIAKFINKPILQHPPHNTIL